MALREIIELAAGVLHIVGGFVGEEGRPDLLSQKFYGTPYLDWFICIANGIKDPLQEITSTTKLLIPDTDRLGDFV